MHLVSLNLGSNERFSSSMKLLDNTMALLKVSGEVEKVNPVELNFGCIPLTVTQSDG